MPALPPLLASSLSGRARRRAAAVGLALGVLMVVLGWRAQGDAPPPAEDRHLSLTPAAPYLLVDPSALGVAGARVALDAPGFLAVARCGDVRALLDGVSVAEPADLGTASAPVRAGAGHGPDPRRSDIWAVIGAAGDRGVLTVAAGTGAPTLASASPAASSPAASSSAASSPAASASSAASAAPSGAGTAPPPSELVVWPPAALITPVRSAASWCSVAATDGTAAAPALTLTVPSARAAGESGRSGPRWWLVLPGLALAVGAGMVLVGRAPGRAGAPDARYLLGGPGRGCRPPVLV